MTVMLVKLHFRCRDGLCIPVSWTCDEHPDCRHGDDEDFELCGKKEECDGFACGDDACYRNMFATRNSTVMMVVTRPRSVRRILIVRPSRVLTSVFSLQRDPLASVGRDIN